MIQELAEEAQAQEEAEVVPIVVAEDKLDHQDPQETTDLQERVELQEVPETPDNRQYLFANKQLHHHVILAPLDHQDHQEAQVLQVTLVQMEIQELEAEIQLRARQDQKDHPDPQDLTEIPANQALQEPQLNLKKQDQDNQDPLEMQAHQDHQDQQDNLDSPAAQEPQDQRDQMETQEPQETMDNQDTLEIVAPQAAQVKKESARNTVPLTEEFSSKMERADVKSHCIQRTRGDLPKIPCPMNQQFPFFIIVAQKTAIYYVSLLYCMQEWRSIFGFFHSLFFLK
jgi:hypothetical protein